MADSTENPFPVLVHPFKSETLNHACLYELIPPSSDLGSIKHKKNALLFIGGLGDGPHTVPMIRTIARQMTEKVNNWSVFEIRLSSSFNQWGFSDLMSDCKEIGEAMKHLKGKMGKDKVVLMGHSTGCQDCAVYASLDTPDSHPLADGFILQAPVSDREYIEGCYKKIKQTSKESLKYASDLILSEGSDAAKDMYMPKRLLPPDYQTGGPISVYRWHSLTSYRGDDDFFSSDLAGMDDPWRRFMAPLLIVPSEKDECVPKHINKAELLGHWYDACIMGIRSKHSGLVPGANHCVDQPESQLWLADRVVRFLDDVEREVQKSLEPVAMFKPTGDGGLKPNFAEMRDKGYLK